MGALGSGRWVRPTRKKTVTACVQLDIRQLARVGALQPGTRLWVPALGCRLEVTDQGLVSYRHDRLPSSTPPLQGQQRLPVLWRACRFGGHRPIFQCPTCPRHAYLLYGEVGHGWRCRTCAALAYPSQWESALLRQMDRANRLRRRLDPGNCLMFPVPQRPARMHRRTYARLVAQIQRHEGGLVPAWQNQLQADRAQLTQLTQDVRQGV